MFAEEHPRLANEEGQPLPDDANSSVSNEEPLVFPVAPHVSIENTPPSTACGPRSKPSTCFAPAHMTVPLLGSGPSAHVPLMSGVSGLSCVVLE